MTAGSLIVVGAREEASGRIALQQATQLAPSNRDRIRLVHVSRLPALQRVLEALTPQRTAPAGHDPDRYQWLQRLADSAGKDGPAVSFEVLDGEPDTAITDHARQADADLIIVATHREGQSREMFIGSTDLRILRSAHCPVLIARGRSAQPYRRAMVAIDLDESGQRVALAANTLLADAAIDLVHAYQVPEEQLRLRGLAEKELASLRELMRADLEERLNAFALAFPSATTHLEQGFVASVILDLVLRFRPDVLVLGKHRGTSSDERAIGSIAQFLLYTCPTDFMLVP